MLVLLVAWRVGGLATDLQLRAQVAVSAGGALEVAPATQDAHKKVDQALTKLSRAQAGWQWGWPSWATTDAEDCQTDAFQAHRAEETASGLCDYIVHEFGVVPPHTEKSVSAWPETAWGKAPQCARDLFDQVDCPSVLHFYTPIAVYTKSDLPDYVMMPVLSKENQTRLGDITSIFINRLNEVGAEYTALFGTMIGMTRPAKTMMPWDDDIDLGMNEKHVERLLAGLPEEPVTKNTPYNEQPWQQAKEAKMFRLSESPHISMLVKSWGVPIKVFMDHKKFPFVDLYTFGAASEQPFCQDGGEAKTAAMIASIKLLPSCSPDKIVIPPAQLKRGHIHQFLHDKMDFYPLSANNGFSLLDGATLELPGVANPEAVLKQDYGNDVIDTCLTSHTHMDATVSSFKFPCKLVFGDPDTADKLDKPADQEGDRLTGSDS